jgi:hypothetical protein
MALATSALGQALETETNVRVFDRQGRETDVSVLRTRRTSVRTSMYSRTARTPRDISIRDQP